MKELHIERTHLSYGNEEYDYLNSLCDYQITRENPFAKVFNDYESFEVFLKECLCEHLGVSKESAAKWLGSYCEEFFAEHGLILLFSDERSGSNRLSLESVETDEDKNVRVKILRDRGLTMDMAYLFLFIEMEKDDYQSVFASISDSNKEASFF